MTAQPPRTSLKEAATQAAVGIPIGLVVSYVVVLLRLPPAISAWLITGLMFLASTIRGYLIRRRFEKWNALMESIFSQNEECSK